MFGFLGQYLSSSVVVGIGAVVVLLRFGRYKAVGGAAIGVIGSAATIGVAVVVSLFGLVALGYWDPLVGKIISDTVTAAQADYDLLGEWVLRQTAERVEDMAV